MNPPTPIRLVLELDPVAAPRQTRRDAWKPTKAVQKYRQFRDMVRAKTNRTRKHIPWGGLTVTFHVPMPKSWPKYRKAEMEGEPHQQKPDVDNLLKALADSLWPADDTHLFDVRARKYWAESGCIEIEWSENDEP